MYSALLQCQNNRWILVTLGNSKLRCSIETYLENCLDAPVKKIGFHLKKKSIPLKIKLYDS